MVHFVLRSLQSPTLFHTINRVLVGTVVSDPHPSQEIPTMSLELSPCRLAPQGLNIPSPYFAGDFNSSQRPAAHNQNRVTDGPATSLSRSMPLADLPFPPPYARLTYSPASLKRQEIPSRGQWSDR